MPLPFAIVFNGKEKVIFGCEYAYTHTCIFVQYRMQLSCWFVSFPPRNGYKALSSFPTSHNPNKDSHFPHSVSRSFLNREVAV